jgi:lactate racemase
MGFIRADRGLDDLKDTKSSGVPIPVLKTVVRLIGPARVRGLVEIVRKKSSVEEKLFAYYALQLMRQYDLFIHVPTLTEEEVKKVGFFTGCREPGEVIRHGLRKIGKKATVAVFPEGGVTFPIVGE